MRSLENVAFSKGCRSPRRVTSCREGAWQLSQDLILHEPAAHLFHRNHRRFHRRTRQKGPRAALQLPRALGGDDDESIGALVRIVRNGAVDVISRVKIGHSTSEDIIVQRGRYNPGETGLSLPETASR